MRYFKSLVALAALIFATSCAIDNIDTPTLTPVGSDVVTVMGRITHFSDCDVDTRGVKKGDEGKITSMALAIFKVNNVGTGLDGNCVYYKYSNNSGELFFTIDRSSKEYHFDINARYAMYVFVNMEGMENFGEGSTLADMIDVAHEVKSVNIPEKGFPMIGSLGDTFSTSFDRDNQTFILSPSDNNGVDLKAPTVNGETQNLLTIPMKALFAKVNFNIAVKPDQTIEGNYSPQFTIEGYTLNNVPTKVDFDSTTNNDTDVTASLPGASISGNLSASGANTINFSFYLPERYLKANSAADHEYPFGKGSEVRPEDKDYMQRYKAELLKEGQKATNIVISGRYRDHQNHYWDVDYTIYLGSDNVENFDIIRNYEYNNYVTIRGIQSSDDMSDNGNAISIDHRVNIERTQPAIISLRREVLLDSHFEVRPLRIRKSDVADANINAVKVEVLNPGSASTKTGTWWMRLERSFGDGTPEGSPETKVNGVTTSIYIDEDSNSPSYGKRKFFTYNLIDGAGETGTNPTLVNSTAVVVPLNEADECVWIYVDECTEVGDAVRSGVIQLTYGSGATVSDFKAANNSAYPNLQYKINQRKLFQVFNGEHTYNIEYEEEYLHNFDADDSYGQTEDEGMAWGLNGLQLSYDHQAILIHNSGMESLTKNIRYAVLSYSPYYDFYLVRDFNKSTYYFENDNQYTSIVHDRNGYTFCNEIITEVNSTSHSSVTSDDIKVLALNQEPKSAIEYCYNKNKRDANGSVVMNNDMGWYLPAIDEIEEIVMSQYTSEGENYYSYARFHDFQDKFYWSSQPAYYKNIFLFERYYLGRGDRMGHYMTDNPNYARATKVNFNGGDPNVSSNYVIQNSGTNTNYYYQYLYLIAGGSILNLYQNVKDSHNHIIEDILRQASCTESDNKCTNDRTTINVSGGYIQFKWDNNDVDETTETIYPVTPITDKKVQPGYMHRANASARVRCVRKMN